MNTNFPFLNAKSFICLAAAACAIISGPVHANDLEVTVKISVSAAGLDLSQPAGAQMSRIPRLKHAAHRPARTATVSASNLRPTLRAATKRHSVTPFIRPIGRS